MKILKFGGTSIGSSNRMKQVCDIVTQEQEVIVVLSAVAGTTDSLISIFNAIKKKDIKGASQTTHKLIKFYEEYVSSLYSSNDRIASVGLFVKEQLQQVLDIVQLQFVPSVEYHLLAKGEFISTELFLRLLEERQVSSQLFSSLEYLRLDQDGYPDETFLEAKFKQEFEQKANDRKRVSVFQGFICRNAFGEISNLKRGGSDYSASLFAAAIKADELQIWTDIDGMHNNDPRYVDGTYPIRMLSYDEAAELAYFGAKILHPSSIKPARKKNIPVRLLNTLDPTAKGSTISSVSDRATIKAVAAKSGITAIRIRSSEMLQAQGFLRKVFEVFELYNTSIDMITTSEVAVSVTIDDEQNLSAIVDTLEEYGTLEIDENLAIICVVGAFLIENKNVAAKVIESLADIPIRMISYGGSSHNISLLVSSDQKVQALNLLQRGIFDG
jgi:aspartate kinase